jgi:hypothetical protein
MRREREVIASKLGSTQSKHVELTRAYLCAAETLVHAALATAPAATASTATATATANRLTPTATVRATSAAWFARTSSGAASGLAREWRVAQAAGDGHIAASCSRPHAVACRPRRASGQAAARHRCLRITPFLFTHT